MTLRTRPGRGATALALAAVFLTLAACTEGTGADPASSAVASATPDESFDDPPRATSSAAPPALSPAAPVPVDSFAGVYALAGAWRGVDGDRALLEVAPRVGDASRVTLHDYDEVHGCFHRHRLVGRLEHRPARTSPGDRRRAETAHLVNIGAFDGGTASVGAADASLRIEYLHLPSDPDAPPAPTRVVGPRADVDTAALALCPDEEDGRPTLVGFYHVPEELRDSVGEWIEIQPPDPGGASLVQVGRFAERCEVRGGPVGYLELSTRREGRLYMRHAWGFVNGSDFVVDADGALRFEHAYASENPQLATRVASERPIPPPDCR